MTGHGRTLGGRWGGSATVATDGVRAVAGLRSRDRRWAARRLLVVRRRFRLAVRRQAVAIGSEAMVVKAAACWRHTRGVRGGGGDACGAEVCSEKYLREKVFKFSQKFGGGCTRMCKYDPKTTKKVKKDAFQKEELVGLHSHKLRGNTLACSK